MKKRKHVVITLVTPTEMILYGIKIKTSVLDFRDRQEVQLYESTNSSGRIIRIVDKRGFICEIFHTNIFDIKDMDKNIWDNHNKGLIKK